MTLSKVLKAQVKNQDLYKIEDNTEEVHIR